ncbi:MAG: polysaccharide biosynthesis protein [Clostridia bacterium]|nr:polysaccharide biosynthesis protein [Clostridia bacterium]
MGQTAQKVNTRKIMFMLADMFIVVMSSLISSNILYNLREVLTVPRRTFWAEVAVTCLVCFATLLICGAYNRLWRYFDTKDYLACAYGVVIGFIISYAIISLLQGKISPYFILLQGLFSLVGICLFRFVFKFTFVKLTRAGRHESVYKRTMLIGAGEACQMLLKEIQNARESANGEQKPIAAFDPICLIDDNRQKVGTHVLNVPVVGTTEDISKFAEKMEIEQILFCIPSCQEEDRKRILDRCSKTNLPIKVIPFFGSLLLDDSKTTLLNQVREINVEDLLRRDPVTFDNEEIQQLIQDKVCMVTGGGGSIGSELVRQIVKYSPKKIVIVDISENYAYDIQQELQMNDEIPVDVDVCIASVRDYNRMNQLFAAYKPQIVFHAAAHKHVPLMEENPMEAIKNNVMGTLYTATLAQFYNVEKFMMISTDKAVNPTNVMGASKRCCEMIVQYLAQQPDSTTKFILTRFGNVLGSNGSVVPKFKKQIESGKPVTITHPDIVRYFMTIPEAASLVLEAAAFAEGGEIFVLDMGKPVKIVTLAEQMISLYGKVPYKDVEIKFTGLRPGEKIKEELLLNEEGLKQTKNKRIFIGKQMDIDSDSFIANLCMLRDAARKNDRQAAVKALHEMVPTFVEPEEYNKEYFALNNA